MCIRHRLWRLRLYVIRERSRAGRAGRNADGRNAGWSDWATLGQPRDAFGGTEPPKDRDLSSPFVLRNVSGPPGGLLTGQQTIVAGVSRAPSAGAVSETVK